MDDRTRDPFILSIGGTKDSRTSLRVVDHKFVIGKEEYLPFVAEMHYFRVAKRHWSICFERIRKANFRIIATAVPWNLHETRQGEFDFAGSTDQAKDLVVFLELCREFGFKIVLRPGPWIASGWDQGGIPDFVVRHPDTLATNAVGEPVMSDPGAGAHPVALPSYLSNRFHILLKNYFSVFCEVVKNYIYPRGPVFMIELDHETSFAGHFHPLAADFNPQGSRAQFGAFLAEKYGALEPMNRLWKTKHKDFNEAVPPETIDTKSPAELNRCLDWIEFREWVVNRYADVLAELLSQTEVSVLFARSLAFHGTYHYPALASAGGNGRVIYTVNLDWSRPFTDTIREARAVAGWQPTGFCTQLAVGAGHADPAAGQAAHPFEARDTKRLLVAALAAGLKGFNFHMFVGRHRWYDAALEADGAILPSYDVIREANTRLADLHYETMRDFADVALLEYRPYQRLGLLGPGESHAHLTELAGAGFAGVASDLMALGYDYRVFDLDMPTRLDKYGTIIAMGGDFMDAAAQERLVHLVRDGAHLILFGLVPRLDQRQEPCEVLAKGIGFRTAPEGGLVAVDAKSGGFTATTWGAIRRTPSRAVKLAKAGTRLVAASSKCGKGQATVVTISPGSYLLPQKLVFFQELLRLGHLTTPVFSSDPQVHVVLQGHAKAALLLVYDTGDLTGMPDTTSASSIRRVVIGADLTPTGMSAAKVALTDVLGTDTYRIGAKDLKNGIEMRLGRGDSHLFCIEKK